MTGTGEPIPGASGPPPGEADQQKPEAGPSKEAELPIETVRQEAARLTRELLVNTLDRLPAHQQALSYEKRLARVDRLGYDRKEEPVRFVLGDNEYSILVEMDRTTTHTSLKRRKDTPTEKDERAIGFWQEEIDIIRAGTGSNVLPRLAFYNKETDPHREELFTVINTPLALEKTNGVLNDLKAGLPSNTTATPAPTLPQPPTA